MTTRESHPIPAGLSAISVMVPVYQCADLLPAHLDFLASISRQVRELIWVITESPDGSDRMAREAASRLGGHILEMPRGLYQAWNAGIAVASGEFLYISTVGDFMERNDGLAVLLALLQKTGAELVISPPRPYPKSFQGRAITRHWPLFTFGKYLKPYSGRVIPKEKAALIQILSGASGLSGSCASCLFQTKTLQKLSFPINYFHYGDTAWLYKNIPKLSIAFCQESLARFTIHPNTQDRVVHKKHIYELTIALSDCLSREIRRIVLDYILANQRIDSIRDPHPKYGWWFLPAAWRFRGERQNLRRELIKKIQS